MGVRLTKPRVSLRKPSDYRKGDLVIYQPLPDVRLRATVQGRIDDCDHGPVVGIKITGGAHGKKVGDRVMPHLGQLVMITPTRAGQLSLNTYNAGL